MQWQQQHQNQQHATNGSSSNVEPAAPNGLHLPKQTAEGGPLFQAKPPRPRGSKHNGSMLCQSEGCNMNAQGGTDMCIAHGGGRRCQQPGCTRGARDRFLCAGHGGGKRCNVPGCVKSAVGASTTCTSHGGGRRCQHENCTKVSTISFFLLSASTAQCFPFVAECAICDQLLRQAWRWSKMFDTRMRESRSRTH